MTRIDVLRSHMKENNISAVVIPTADMHLSEYISDHYKLREYLSGFTGSAGTLVVTCDDAGLWTDGRYYIQAEKELSGSGIKLFKASEKETLKIHEYLKNTLSAGETVGVDGRLFSKKYLDSFISKLQNINVNTDYDASVIWENRPEEPSESAFVLGDFYSGKGVEEKLSEVRNLMKKQEVTHYLLTSPECIMWLLNIRGNDVKYTPVMLSYLLMTQRTVTLYTNPKKLTKEVLSHLKLHNIETETYQDIYSHVEEIEDASCVATDFSLTNYSLINKITCAKKQIKDYVNNLKAIKNNAEIENIKNAYIRENTALTKAFYEIYYSSGIIDECDVVDIIEKYRKLYTGYYSPAFDTIAAFNANAAMMHYDPEREKCSQIRGDGLLLIDTGGQYFEGTTDTTRTLVFGEIPKEWKESLTLVLKSHIAMASSVFPADSRCSELDAIARMPLWKKGLDYRCSTGHGVGYMLSVHEGPQRLSVKCDEVLRENMTVTDEPGIYMENEYGIRTENHLCVKSAFETEYGKFMKFEVLNYCPLGVDGLIPDLLSTEEREWLNNYNEKCRKLINPYLTEEEAKWLSHYTRTI